MSKKNEVIVKNTKPLFWPIIWIILCFPIGIIWTSIRLHENSKITEITRYRNGFLIFVSFFIILAIVANIFPSLSTDSTVDISAIDNKTTASQYDNIDAPAIELQFIKLITSYYNNYESAPNELQKSTLRADRKEKLSQLIKENPKNWVGTIKNMGTTGDGNAILSVNLPNSNIVFTTNNNEFSDALSIHTLIPLNSSLFKKLSNLKEGDKIKFSSYFIKSDKDSIAEQSITEEGAMTEPEFLVKFTNITKID